jgi:hypothetical protein
MNEEVVSLFIQFGVYSLLYTYYLLGLFWKLFAVVFKKVFFIEDGDDFLFGEVIDA